MSLSARSRGVKIAFVVGSVILVAFGSFIILAAPQASAETDPKLVRGYVKDSVGRVLEGASIVVNIWDPTNTTLRATRTDTTDPDGYYGVNFESTDWMDGDWIEVLSDYDGKQHENGTVAKVIGLPFIQWVYIIYPYEIPEFGTPVGLIVAGISVGAVAVVLAVYFRRK